MEVRITEAQHKAHKRLLTAAPFEKCAENGRDYFRYDKHYVLDLARYGKADLLNLAGALSKTPELPGTKTLVRDINTWVEACTAAGLEKARARTVKQACKLVTELLRRTERRHIYTRLQEADDGVCLAGYVGEIKYCPRDKRRDYEYPEHFDFKWWYEEFGIIHKSEKTFMPDDCLGLTAQEILTRNGIFVETPSLRAGYESCLAEYKSVRDAVGRQYLARGLADDSGIDGNDKDNNQSWYRSSRLSKFVLDAEGVPSRVVIDVFREQPTDQDREKDSTPPRCFWNKQINRTLNDETGEEEALLDDDEMEASDEDNWEPEIPVHPYVACFDLKRHKRLRIHVGNLKLYEYNPKIRERLVLPESHGRLIDTLLVSKETKFKDVVAGKSGGTIILCQGPPGTGKTLTAEIYAEALGRALYTVQCSQLGVAPEELEDNLMKVLARGRRWGAVMLLDEADVYVNRRGTDLNQNAVVGVFLRVLEYHSGVLFLTTNRGDLVDDAILSRCTARVPYGVPTEEMQIRIWGILAAMNDLWLPEEEIRRIVAADPHLSGRDIKNLFKLASVTIENTGGGEITAEIIEAVKVFKPATGG